MEEKKFRRLLLTVTGLCILLTAAHLAWAVWAYRHCSIITFIAKELW